jgi:hypothetical protein
MFRLEKPLMGNFSFVFPTRTQFFRQDASRISPPHFTDAPMIPADACLVR